MLEIYLDTMKKLGLSIDLISSNSPTLDTCFIDLIMEE